MRINLIRPAIILLTIALTVSAVGCKSQTTNTEVYSPATSAININVSPPGSGSVSPLTGNYTNGTNVTFVATPAAGYVFSSWWYGYEDSTGGRGGVIGKNATLNLAVERSENVTAYFVALPGTSNNSVKTPIPDISLPPEKVQYTLKVLVDPPGAGSVSAVNGTYDAGTSVTMNATPASGYKVLQWNIYDKGGIGGISGSTSYTTVMDSDKVILVSFTSLNNTNPVRSTPPQTSIQSAYPLEVIVDPPWAGSVSPASGVYNAGTNVTLVATPASGYVLSNWNWNNNTLTTTINSITIVTVHFVVSPSIWNNAVFLGQARGPIASGDYFYLSQDYTAGMFGPDSVSATYDASLVALIDRKSGGFAGPLTPGMHAAAVWLLFRALKPGTAQISVTQIRNGYSDPPKTYSVTIGN